MMTLDEAVQMALTNNLDIQISKYTPILDQFALNGLYSAYDPALSVSATRNLHVAAGGKFHGIYLPPERDG